MPSPAPDRRRAAALLGAVGLVAAIEWFAAASSYRAAISPADWDAAAAALAALPPGEPVVLADDWLGPGARARLPAVARDVGLPDLHGAPRLHVLALADPRTRTVVDDLAGLAPTFTGADDLGAFTLHHVTLPGAGPVLWDILADPSVAARDDRGPCRRSKGTWSCKQGRATVRFAEVGYRPRRCLALELTDGATLELSARVSLGARLRGHLGLSDFNGRLRSDAPVLVELAVDGLPRARWLLTDMQGWAAFELPTAPGPAALTVRVTSLLAGTSTPGGYDPDARRVPCLELRALAEAP